MASDPKSAGIALSPSAANGAKYSVMGTSGQHPVSFVGFDDAARFVNWMSNGQGNGDTESGVYAKTGNSATFGAFTMIHSAAATIWVPSMDEWYKAAYYDPTLNSGSGGYWDYATRSDTAPSNDYATATSANHANYSVSGSYTLSPGGYPNDNALTDVGTFSASISYYGTYDQNGNVEEFIANTSDSESQYYYMGGGWASTSTNLTSDGFSHAKFGEFPLSFSGFRVAGGPNQVPEPSASLLLIALTGGLLTVRRR
jgi:formylglycine-generating enzyme required for sulfatase activity